jgi:hypothetical protein
VLDFEDASSPTSLSVESGAEPSAGADEEPDAASRRRLPKISGFPVSLHAAAARPIITENSPCEPLEVLGGDALPLGLRIGVRGDHAPSHRYTLCERNTGLRSFEGAFCDAILVRDFLLSRQSALASLAGQP